MTVKRLWPESDLNTAYVIYGWVNGGKCLIEDFLVDLKSLSPNDWKRIVSMIARTAEHGPPRDEEQCRALEGDRAEGLFEFKTRGGVRVLWFYDRERIIICTHGFIKKSQKTPPGEIERAQLIKRRYFEERQK
jgi:phage-related protein